MSFGIKNTKNGGTSKQNIFSLLSSRFNSGKKPERVAWLLLKLTVTWFITILGSIPKEGSSDIHSNSKK